MPAGHYPRTEYHRKRLSEGQKGKKKSFHSEEHKRNLALAHTGLKQSKETIEKRVSKVRGINHWRWIEDRTQLSRISKQGERRTSAYFEWRKQVWLRDNYKCKIANPDCSGRLEAHHILGFTEHPELRYEINNGITLCHAHHPRKRAEEKRLIPTFQELVSVSKIKI